MGSGQPRFSELQVVATARGVQQGLSCSSRHLQQLGSAARGQALHIPTEVRRLSDGRVMLAADVVCEAIRRHAATCEREPRNVAAVIRDGEALCEAVLQYEAALRATSGW